MTLEWANFIVAAISAALGAVGGLIAGVWRVSHIEQDLRKDFMEDITEATNVLSGKLSRLADQFDETLKGLRQKINDVELQTEREFVSKTGFDEFRKEFREDMKSLNEKLDRITRPGPSQPKPKY